MLLSEFLGICNGGIVAIRYNTNPAYTDIGKGTNYGMPVDNGLYLRIGEVGDNIASYRDFQWPVIHFFFEWGYDRIWYKCANPHTVSLSWIQLK